MPFPFSGSVRIAGLCAEIRDDCVALHAPKTTSKLPVCELWPRLMATSQLMGYGRDSRGTLVDRVGFVGRAIRLHEIFRCLMAAFVSDGMLAHIRRYGLLIVLFDDTGSARS